MSPGEGADGKDVAYFSALVTAWIETKMERDKTIVTLSAGAIGLLVTLLTTVGVKTPWMLLLYTGAVGGFAVAAGYSIVIFDSNSVHIEEVIKGGTEDNKTLRRLDKRTLTFFTLGVIFTVLIGVTAAVTSLHHGAPMNEEAKTSPTPSQETFTKSLNGVQNLKPHSPDGSRSLNGIQNLKPQAVPPQPSQVQAESAQPPAAATPTPQVPTKP